MTTAGSGTDSGRHRGGHASGSRRVLVRRGVQVLAALVSATLLVAMGYYRYTYSSLEQGLHHLAAGGLGPKATTSDGKQIAQVDGQAKNLLLIGDDSRDGLSAKEIKKLHVGIGDGESTSTDTLLIVHVPADGSKATLISIPRDSYVDIPGFSKFKINAAYVDGYNNGTDGYPVTSASTEDERQTAGLTLLNRVVENLTGLEIDNDVMVNFIGFYDIAQAIGGITVNLCRAVDDTASVNENEGNGAAGSGFKMGAGVHHLTPVQALQFVRQRHNIYNAQHNDLGDIGREARQRYFLAAAFKEMESAGTLLSPSRLNSLIGAVKKTLTIGGDLSLLDLAHQMVDLESGNIVGNTIPTEGSAEIDGPGDVLLVDPAKVQAQIQKWLNPVKTRTTPTRTASSAPASSSASSGSAVQQADKGCIN